MESHQNRGNLIESDKKESHHFCSQRRNIIRICGIICKSRGKSIFRNPWNLSECFQNPYQNWESLESRVKINNWTNPRFFLDYRLSHDIVFAAMSHLWIGRKAYSNFFQLIQIFQAWHFLMSGTRKGESTGKISSWLSWRGGVGQLRILGCLLLSRSRLPNKRGGSLFLINCQKLTPKNVF